MSLSSKRIIKVRAPIRNVTVLNVSSNPEPETASREKTEEFDSNFTAPEAVAEELVQMSQSEFQQEIDFAFRRGVEEGKLQGYQQAEADYREKVENLRAIALAFQKEREIFFRENEDKLIELVLKIARRIVQELPPFVPKLIHHTIHKVLEVLGTESELEVHVSPEDYQDMEQLQQAIEKRLVNIEQLSFKPDPRIQRGGCIIETPAGKIDARIETQIQTLFQGLRKQLKTIQNQETDSHESGGKN